MPPSKPSNPSSGRSENGPERALPESRENGTELARLEAELEQLKKENARLRALADAPYEAIAFFGADMRCVTANATTLRLFGYESESELLGKHVLEFVAPESREEVSRRFQTEDTRAYELMGLRRNGETFPAEAHGKKGVFNGQPVRISAMRDITRRKQIERELQTAANELEIIFAYSKVGLMLLRGGRWLAKANQALADILGYDTPEKMIGRSMRELHLTEENFQHFGEKYYNALADKALLHIEYRLRRKDGSPVWCMLSGQALDRGAPADLNKGVLWAVDDITRIKTQEQELRALACTDYLTGVHNRRHFLDLASRELKRRKRHGGDCGLLLIDLDRFKDVNDQLGHGAGDAVLKTFARRCCGALREVDIFGRLGGEEFAVLLPGSDLEGARTVAERIREGMSDMETRTPEGNIRVTVSIGVTSTERPVADVEALIARADKALYRAKRLGRDRVEIG
ncbi:sensor domain-containing diguanylate cyclase [Paucidesulfovibrio longus]|uniref:sensor domain-containing diguanylate cyclase n=1 Tax=Paucidesulfovibrio longus TaxID=889 RepID=UPI0003B67979|nr:diguanylate cyclase [Paucidesulfovibrio longus]